MLNDNELEILPDNFGYIRGVRDLILNNNKLKKLPESFGNIEILGNLLLNDNELEILPDSFGHIYGVCDLMLNNNKLEILPDSFGHIHGICDLLLHNNKLEKLPDSFGNIQFKGVVELYNNKLQTVPATFKEKFILYNKANVQKWVSIYNTIYNIDYEIKDDIKYNFNKTYNISHLIITIKEKDMFKLETKNFQLLYSLANFNIIGDLILGNNNFKILPENFGNIVVGKNLVLTNNQLETLPESFGNIKIGGSLILDDNKLEILPDNFGSINVGGNLELSYNYLQTLPDSFGSINIVDNLYLNNNQLQTLPDSFGNINIGGDLYLNNNLLKILPINFGNIRCNKLNLSNNLLKILPINYTNFSNVKNILLNNNYFIERPFIKTTYTYDNQKLETTNNKKNCSFCKHFLNCKKCAICKVDCYCDINCEINAWTNHSIVCNDIINTTFIIVAHGRLIDEIPNIINKENMNIITLNTIGKSMFESTLDNLINIYTSGEYLFEDNDKNISKRSESGDLFNDMYKDKKDVKLSNRSYNEIKYLNNVSLEFYDNEFKDLEKKIKIYCFKKHRNGKLEIDNKYEYNTFNYKKINLDNVINKIVNIERYGNKNIGHITFIINVCRGFPKSRNKQISKIVNNLMRSNSDATDNAALIIKVNSDDVR